MEMDNVSLDSLEDMDELEAYELAEQHKALLDKVAEVEAKRQKYLQLFQKRIQETNDVCDAEIKPLLGEIEFLEEKLRRYTQSHITDKCKTIKMPGVDMSLKKRQPKFFDPTLKEVNGYNDWLIGYAEQHAKDCIKVKEIKSVDWLKFKGKLKIDDDLVSFRETGEVIEGLQAQQLPDEFKINHHD